jgi:hypothetical protein
MSEIDRIVAEASKDPTNMSVLEFGDNQESLVGTTKTRTVSMGPSSLETIRQNSLPKNASVEEIANKRGSYLKFKTLLGN